MVGFSSKQRHMGTSARNQLVMNPMNTIWGFKSLIGRKFSDPIVQEAIKGFPYEVVQQPGDEIGIKVHYSDEDHLFSPKQLTAMFLTYLKQTTEKAISKPVADCVISVPDFFTDTQRRALLDAAAIAGLNCLRLMNDTTAAALSYGIYKQDLPEESEKPRNVVFVSMGHSSLQVCISSFHKGKLKVLSKAFDPTLGGNNFDQRLVTHFAEVFDKKYKIDSLRRPRQRLRLANEIEKLKKNMSANSTSIPLNIDCFADDKDVSAHMARSEFLDLCQDLMERVTSTVQDALAKSGLKAGEIDSVEVVGGSCRIPAVKDAISAVFHHGVSTTLNMDEAVARGCALQCAMLSPTFKVRDFKIEDIQPYPIMLKWRAAMEGEEGEMVVFKEGDAIYHSKVLSFYRKEPFELEACYQYPNNIPYLNPIIGNFRVKNVSPTEEGEASKVKVKVRMNIHGVFFVKSATMVEKQKVEEEESMESEPTAPSQSESQAPNSQDNSQEGGNAVGSEQPTEGATPTEDATPTEGATPTEATDSSTADQPMSEPGEQSVPPEQNGATPPEQNETTPPEQNPSDSDKSQKPGKKEEQAKQAEAKKPKKPTIKYVDLPIDEQTPSLAKTLLDRAREKEVNMAYQDQLEKERADAKNAVEEYVYNTRDKVEYSLSEFIAVEEKGKFLELLNATEEWLYDEGEDQPKKVYVARLEEMKKLGNPVLVREQEWEGRPKAFDLLAGVIVHYEKILEQHAAGDEQYAHIEPGEMQKVREAVDTKRQWMHSQMQVVSALPKHADPPVKCVEISAEQKNLETTCKPIVTKPKPKVEPPKDDQPKPEGGEGTNTEGEQQEEDKMEEAAPGSAEQTTRAGGSQPKQDEQEDMDLD